MASLTKPVPAVAVGLVARGADALGRELAVPADSKRRSGIDVDGDLGRVVMAAGVDHELEQGQRQHRRIRNGPGGVLADRDAVGADRREQRREVVEDIGGGAPMQVGDPGHQRNAARQRTEAELLCAPAGLSTLAHRGHQLGQQPSDVGILLVASDRE